MQDGAGVREVHIRGFRSAHEVRFAPGQVCALVGGPSVGKSNVLAAIWMLLQRGEPAPSRRDLTTGVEGDMRLRALLHSGEEVSLQASPPDKLTHSGRRLPVLFLPASRRSGRLLQEPITSQRAADLARSYLANARSRSPAATASGLLAGLERLRDAGERGLVMLIEEPELFLAPQAQRYLYRVLRAIGENGNQVLYSTHEPTMLNVGRLEELALVEHSPHQGTIVKQPKPLGAEQSFRAISEIDAERGELFLARAVLLVEGRTEKLSFPFVFRALGHDVDRESITIVDCGGKPNIPLFIRICRAAQIPCLVVHDRDAPVERRPSRTERSLNAEIATLCGAVHPVQLAPDFEAVAGLRGHRRKPSHAWLRFSEIEPGEIPHAFKEIVERTVALARR